MSNVMPVGRVGWVRVLALPFKTYLFAVAAVYPYWRLHTPGNPGALGSGALTESLTVLAAGYFISGAALLFVALVQFFLGDKRCAAWNVGFSIVALLLGNVMSPPLLK
jgi:hypothetical protein